MRKLCGLLLAVVVICLSCAYGIHLFRNYARIQADMRSRGGHIIRPAVDDESVSEIGYLFSMRRDKYIREGRFNLVWFIAIPATNTRYSCVYEAGFPDFKVGDGVRVIHKRAGIDAMDYTGYVIGLHEREMGKVAEVEAVDLEQLNDPPDYSPNF